LQLTKYLVNCSMKALSLIFSMILLAVCGLAQPRVYYYKYQVDSVLINDKSSVRYQLGAFNYSMIGEHKLNLSTYDHFRRANDITELSGSKKKTFASYKPEQAIPYIIEQAKKTSIVIINEAHNHPEHRVFAAKLLPHLKKLGYNFIGFEALNYSDKNLNIWQYPLIQEWSYTNEPAFGKLIRQARALKFTTFAYEADDDADNKEREIQQANNILAVVNKYPKAKFVIYCGYDHAIEDSLKNWGLAMAGRVKRLTKVDPLTIDQAQLAETSDTAFDNPYRRLINLPYSAVFINAAGKAFGEVNEPKRFDMNVYHAKTHYFKARPHWLKNAGDRYVYVTGKINIKFPCLVYAYEATDPVDKAVPLDVIQLDSKNDLKHLILPKGRVIIKVTNALGQKQVLKLL
jgi:hypothetical protein